MRLLVTMSHNPFPPFGIRNPNYEACLSTWTSRRKGKNAH
jgi:hypothetical protein